MSHFQPVRFQARLQLLFSGTGISGTLQAHHLATPEMGNDSIDGVDHETQVRFAMTVERGGHTDDQGICGSGPAEVGSPFEPAACRHVRYSLRVNVADVTPARS